MFVLPSLTICCLQSGAPLFLTKPPSETKSFYEEQDAMMEPSPPYCEL